MELPDFSNASKLERGNLSLCTNLCYIHPSLLHLDTIVELNVNDFYKLTTLKSESYLKSLKQLFLFRCSSLKEFSLCSEIEVLMFLGTAIDILPSSIGRCKNLKTLIHEDRGLKIPRKIFKSTSIKKLYILERGFDPSNLHVLFDAFPCLEEFRLMNCDTLFQLPDNISALLSLKELILKESSVESLPTNIKHLLRLKHLDVSDCERLQSLPELPPSIISLKARNCSSLETLIPSAALQYCDLEGCVKLDQQSLYGITTYSHYRIKRALPTCVCLPGDRVPWWFSYWTTQDWISIELPPGSDLLGFAFYFAVFHDILEVNCVRCLDASETKEWATECELTEFITDNIYLWYDDSMSDSLNAMEGRSYGYVKFQLTYLSNDLGIKEFGVCPIYASSELELELELGDKSKRHFELEANEQQQLPLTETQKIQTCSN